MSSTSATIELPAPPDEVWSLVTDLSRMGDWVTIHAGFPEPPPDAVREGTEFDQTIAIAGQSVDVHWTAKRVSEPRELVWEAEGPAGATARTRYALEPAGDGATRFEYTSEYELPGGVLGRIAGKAVEPRSENEAESSLERLRALFGR